MSAHLGSTGGVAVTGGAARPSDQERLARAGLLRCCAPTALTAARLAECGAQDLWARLRTPHVPEPGRDLARAAALGARLLIPGDEEWPACLEVLSRFTASRRPDDRASGRDHGVPIALWVRGSLRLDETVARSAALVGARAATGYGTYLAADLGAGLAERDATVVSGGAYGIDAAAHRGALAAGGATVAVLAGGIDVPYPLGNAPLLDRIAAEGLIVTEAPPGSTARRERFLTRNRLIAALSGGVVMVEAGLRSGAGNTLAHARHLGRPRMAVPGPVTSALSAGCHALLRQDPEARLVTCAADVLEEMGRIGADLAVPAKASPDARDQLAEPARLLLAAMPARGVWSLGRIATQMEMGRTAALALAGTLTAHGWLEQLPEGFRLTAQARAPLSR